MLPPHWVLRTLRQLHRVLQQCFQVAHMLLMMRCSTAKDYLYAGAL